MNIYKMTLKMDQCNKQLSILAASIEKVKETQEFLNNLINKMVKIVKNDVSESSLNTIVSEIESIPMRLIDIGVNKKYIIKNIEDPIKLMHYGMNFCIKQLSVLTKKNKRIVNFIKKHTFYFEEQETLKSKSDGIVLQFKK